VNLLYHFDLTVPAGRPAERPIEKRVVVKHPVLHKVGVYFPPGPTMLVYVAIFYGDLQVWPAKEGKWARGEDLYYEDTLNYELPEKETTLTLKGYAPNTGFDHTVYFYLYCVERPFALWPVLMLNYLRALREGAKRFAELIGLT